MSQSGAAVVIGCTSNLTAGTIAGEPILMVPTTLLTLMHLLEAARRILYGLIILIVTSVYVWLTGEG